jgi:hypothetical protein
MYGLQEYFEVWQIGGGQMTEARIREMITEGCRQTAKDLVNPMKVKLDLLASSFEESTGSSGRVVLHRNGRLPQKETYRLRTNNLSQLTRLPDDFQFPNKRKCLGLLEPMQYHYQGAKNPTIDVGGYQRILVLRPENQI